MNTTISLAFLAVLSLASACGTKPCHESLFITNESDSTVIFAQVAFEGGSLLESCRLGGDSVLSGHTWEFDLMRECFEERLVEGKTMTIFVVDPDNYNDPDAFYDCDLLEERNTILREWEISLEDLQARDFELEYL